MRDVSIALDALMLRE